TFPVVAPLVMNPVNQALDDLEWRWNIGSGSGFHQAGAIVIPAIATGGLGGVGGVAARVGAKAPRVLAQIILPKGVNPEPLTLYRGMRAAEDGYPEVGETAKTLGARPKIFFPEEQGDVVIDDRGWIWPGTGGMSANTDPWRIPLFRRPLSFGGTGKGLDMFTIEDQQLPPGLSFRLIEDGHGYIEPTRPMTYDEVQRLIHGTRGLWIKTGPTT
uniref:hypothetical protein n=1 Tax=Lapillicoccus sp. TaxID=1909287 RepID=UPI0025DE0851